MITESQVILEYLEDNHPGSSLYPAGVFARAKCRELIQHLELNAEWVARRLYEESFFGGRVSEETKSEACQRLALGLASVAQLASFSPFALGATFTAADCVAYMHFVMIRHTTLKVFGEDLTDQFLPDLDAYMQLMNTRPHVQAVMAAREIAIADFLRLEVAYDG